MQELHLAESNSFSTEAFFCQLYSTRPQNLLELEQNIRASCGLVTQDLLQGIGQECVKRWLKCLEIGGFHVEV